MMDSVPNHTPGAANSIDDVIAWIEKMAQRGMYNGSTARFKQNAIEQFVTVLGPDEPRTAAYLKENVEAITKRWATKEAANPETARTYKSRALGAVNDFMSYMEDPSSFKPKATTSRTTTPKKADKSKKVAPPSKPEVPQEASRAPMASPGPQLGSAGTSRTFPLGKDREPFIYVVPDGMVVSDVIKIACHLVTLAEDFDPLSAKTAAVFSLARREQP